MKAPEELGIGMMVRFDDPPEISFRRLREIGLCHCQFAAPSDEYLYGGAGRENTKKLLDAIAEYDICVTSLFISFPGQDWSNWKNTIGLVPPATRAQRMARACRSADWARELGIVQIASHVGCIPENPDDPEYPGLIEALRGLCRLLEANGQVMAYETGQESLKTLAKTMNDVGVDNQKINFDPANLLIYNQDDPMRLVKTMGELVVHVHCKDACRPANPDELGIETRLGDGDTGFASLLRALYSQGYRGPLTIEREIPPGPEQRADIIYAVKLIEAIKRELKQI